MTLLMKRHLFLAAAILSGSFHASALEPGAPARDERMSWWRDAKFGLFIHWGVYAVPAGTWRGKQVGGAGEWMMYDAKIPVDEYRKFAADFNPIRYDPQSWAELAESAGMKYVVITAKHHDGFSLYDSKVSRWDVVDATPYGRDLLAPLVDAVRGRGLKMGLYYSHAQDWTHPGGAKMRFEEGAGWDKRHNGDFDKYLDEIAIPQVGEILEAYKPDVLWWDTPVWMDERRARKFLPLVRRLPGLIMNDRLGGGISGDTETPENFIPATGIPGRDWETCMTMNDTWGYVSYDDTWKPTRELIHKLVDIVSKGGNYLLNVGPMADGTIPAASVERLHGVGTWMKVNGEAIYGTIASPGPRPRWGRMTAKVKPGGHRIYLHVFDWPQDGILRVPLHNDVSACALLADPSRFFSPSRTEDGVEIRLTGNPPDKDCTVLALDIAGPPVAADVSIRQAADGSLDLPAEDATVHNGNFGKLARIEADKGISHIGNWHDPRSWAGWSLRITEPGSFTVELDVAAEAPGAGFSLGVGGKETVVKIPDTASLRTYQTVRVGQIIIGQEGRCDFSVTPAKDGWRPVNLRRVRLIPVETR